jgi:hypothetical protein
MKRSDTTKAIERFLEEHGIADYGFVWSTRHPRVVVTYAGRTVCVSFSNTAVNWNAANDAVRRLRHGLGLVDRAGA